MTKRYSASVAKLRYKEQGRRNALAQQRAFAALRDRHLDEYYELYDAHKRKVRRERGPLPGDD